MTWLLLLAFFASKTLRSSRSVTQIQNQLAVSTKAKAKKTRFLRASPPHEEGRYEGLLRAAWAEGWWVRREEEGA